jgi:hypothetical protein
MPLHLAGSSLQGLLPWLQGHLQVGHVSRCEVMQVGTRHELHGVSHVPVWASESETVHDIGGVVQAMQGGEKTPLGALLLMHGLQCARQLASAHAATAALSPASPCGHMAGMPHAQRALVLHCTKHVAQHKSWPVPAAVACPPAVSRAP